MATFNLLIQSSKERANIYVNLSVGRGKVWKRKTGYITKTINWNEKKGEPKAKDHESKKLKLDLSQFLISLEEKYNQANKKGTPINGKWLEKAIDEITNKPKNLDTLQDFVQNALDNAHKRKNHKGGYGLSYNRKRVYISFKNFMERYDADVKIHEIDLDYIEDLGEHMSQVPYSKNYIAKMQENLVMFCKDAGNLKVKDYEPRREKKKAEHIIYLTEAEQELIANAKLDREALINARKWLLLGCLIGQRGGDLLGLNERRITEVKGVKIIEITQQKGNKQVVVPLLPKALEIIEDGFPYPISLQNFNDYIKDVCKAAGLDNMIYGCIRQGRGKGSICKNYPKWMLCSSHICRRSFASNFYTRINTATLRHITGHSSEDMFMRYIGKAAFTHALDFNEMVRKLG